MSDKTVIVMPAYNAEKTLERTIREIPAGCYDEIIVVDDFSKDGTVRVAKELGLRVIEHDRNKGYGGNQKTCYREALKAGAAIIVMVHPDYQYDPRVIPGLLLFLRDNICDIMLGNRVRTRREAITGGMPLYKYLANRALTIAENLLLGQNLGEWHTGLRAYKRKVLDTIPWESNSDDFVFDQELLIQAAYFGFRIGDVPVPTKYFKEASSINFIRSSVYGIQTLWAILKLFIHKTGIFKSKLFFSKYRSNGSDG